MLAGHSGYDIVVPTSEPTFSRLIAAGALLPLDKAKLPDPFRRRPGVAEARGDVGPGQQVWRDLSVGDDRARGDPVEAEGVVPGCAAGQLGPAVQAGERQEGGRVRHHHDGQRDGRDPLRAEIPASRPVQHRGEGPRGRGEGADGDTARTSAPSRVAGPWRRWRPGRPAW